MRYRPRCHSKALSFVLSALFLGCFSGAAFGAEKVILLGMDGLDPQLLEKFMAEGRLPHFKELKDRGG